MTNGGRNLMILGAISIVAALCTAGVSLAVYHSSGDIYLDRSRPGYLPDEEEVGEEVPEEDYEFSKSGVVTKDVLDEYVQALEGEVKVMDLYENPFNEDALSDERLGL